MDLSYVREYFIYVLNIYIVHTCSFLPKMGELKGRGKMCVGLEGGGWVLMEAGGHKWRLALWDLD